MVRIVLVLVLDMVSAKTLSFSIPGKESTLAASSAVPMVDVSGEPLSVIDVPDRTSQALVAKDRHWKTLATQGMAHFTDGDMHACVDSLWVSLFYVAAACIHYTVTS